MLVDVLPGDQELYFDSQGLDDFPASTNRRKG